ncbi:MAG TPA: hypothetical protein VNS53_03190 [Sphingomicrobium sp.]|jgi:hypothetical protein|nr:hypothetical protein [Sphingomicrobium sp.]
MLYRLSALSFLLVAAPAIAAPPPQPDDIQIPHELTDPAMADKLSNMVQAISQAFLQLPVGEVQAAAEGRQPTAQEKKLTVRDLGRRDNPDFDRDFGRQIAQTKPMIQQSMSAFSKALPAITRSLSQAAEALDQAAANMPQPMDQQR